MGLHKLYLAARTDETKRELFIDELAFESSELYNHGVSEIIYDPTGHEYFSYAREKYKEGMMTEEELNDGEPDVAEAGNFAVPIQYSRMGLDDRFPVFVFKNAFKTDSLDEFLIILEGHEAVHTEDLMRGVDIADIASINYKNTDRLRLGMLACMLEIRADNNMTIQARKKKLDCTRAYHRGKERLPRNLSKLKDISEYPHNKFERAVGLHFLDEFYRQQNI